MSSRISTSSTVRRENTVSSIRPRRLETPKTPSDRRPSNGSAAASGAAPSKGPSGRGSSRSTRASRPSDQARSSGQSRSGRDSRRPYPAKAPSKALESALAPRHRPASALQLKVAEIIGFEADFAYGMSISNPVNNLVVVGAGDDSELGTALHPFLGCVVDLRDEKMIIPGMGTKNIVQWNGQPLPAGTRKYAHYRGMRIRAFRYQGVTYFASARRLDLLQRLQTAREAVLGSGKLMVRTAQIFEEIRLPKIEYMFGDGEGQMLESCSTVYEFTIVHPTLSRSTRKSTIMAFAILLPRHRLCKNSLIEGPPGSLVDDRLPSDMDWVLNSPLPVNGGTYRAAQLSDVEQDRESEPVFYKDFLEYGFMSFNDKGRATSPEKENASEAIDVYDANGQCPLTIMSPMMYERYLVAEAAGDNFVSNYDRLIYSQAAPRSLQLLEPVRYNTAFPPKQASYDVLSSLNSIRNAHLARYLDALTHTLREYAFTEFAGRLERYRGRFAILIKDAETAGVPISAPLFPILMDVEPEDRNFDFERPEVRREIDLLEGILAFVMNAVNYDMLLGGTDPSEIHRVLRMTIYDKDFMGKLAVEYPTMVPFLESATTEWSAFSKDESTRMDPALIQRQKAIRPADRVFPNNRGFTAGLRPYYNPAERWQSAMLVSQANFEQEQEWAAYAEGDSWYEEPEW